MDTIVQAALEEICSRGAAGLPLRELWSELQPALSSHGFTLSPKFKQLLWTNLLDIPDLQFKSNRGAYGPRDDCIRSVVDSERLNLTIVAPEHLLDSFVGIYDVEASDAKVSAQQRRVLELLAIARGNGITQSELTKALGVRGNDIFYILKKLESRGMITRQSTVVRTKEASNEEESKNASVVTTNMVHLYRYAKHLGCHQRLEITKGNKSFMCIDNTNGNAASVDCFSEESTKEDVHIRDFLPALKAICDKLEKAEGKVLVVSDIKRDLGYKGSGGHKSWRNICNRFKEARVVEEFLAKVDGKATMDVSSDLTELGRTPVTVISAGVKSILYIPRTLEYLETQGVCVAAYQTNEFPAFFSEASGCKAPCRVDTPEDCARLIDKQY